jgi:probable rRNA maturation factor
MTIAPDSGDALAIDLAEPCAAWRQALPDVERLCREAALAAIAATGVQLGDAELSLVLTDNSEIHELNRRWRGKDAPTNVLSFPAEAERPAPDAPLLLGDIVLAFETVAREARTQGKRLDQHLTHLVVHGVLHLLGYDHEVEPEALRMEALETEILFGLGVPDPYRVSETERN